jgi:hypothetical protein
VANNIQDNLNLAAEILSYLLNTASIECRGKFSVDDLSDAINTCFACGSLLELREIERLQQEKGRKADK